MVVEGKRRQTMGAAARFCHPKEWPAMSAQAAAIRQCPPSSKDATPPTQAYRHVSEVARAPAAATVTAVT